MFNVSEWTSLEAGKCGIPGISGKVASLSTRASLTLRIFVFATARYRTNLTQSEVDTWILIGEPSKRQPVIHCKRYIYVRCGVNGVEDIHD